MPKLSEEKLKKFAKKQHKKYLEQALVEGAVAFMPLIAILFGLGVVFSRPNAQEYFSPGRIGIGTYLFPILIVAYLVFLIFILGDIRKRVKRL